MDGCGSAPDAPARRQAQRHIVDTPDYFRDCTARGRRDQDRRHSGRTGDGGDRLPRDSPLAAMAYSVQVQQLESVPLAVIKRQVNKSELPRVIPECCGLVWNEMRAQQ